MYNAYLHILNGSHTRVILAQGVTYAEAEAACRAQVVYLPKLGRLGDTWFSAGFYPRLVIADVDKEPTHLLEPKPITIEQLVARIMAKYEP